MAATSCWFQVSAMVLSVSGTPRVHQPLDPGDALVVGAGHARDALVGLARHPVEADLDRVRAGARSKRSAIRSVTSVPLVKTVTSSPLRDRVEVELGEVGAHQHLAAGEQHVQAARLRRSRPRAASAARAAARARAPRSSRPAGSRSSGRSSGCSGRWSRSCLRPGCAGYRCRRVSGTRGRRPLRRDRGPARPSCPSCLLIDRPNERTRRWGLGWRWYSSCTP